jgi:hypothetical protein
MKLREAADWAEVVSAVAIVISLVYVGVQMNDNTAATRSATASHSCTALIDWYTHLCADAETLGIWYRGVREPDSLNDEEQLRFIFLLHIVQFQYQNNFYLVQEGTLDKKVLQSITLALTTITGPPQHCYTPHALQPNKDAVHVCIRYFRCRDL